MINLPVDEAYAFDYLSILEVKGQNTDQMKLDLSFQVGNELFKTILESKEYCNLKQSNTEIFQQIESIRKGNPLQASEIDNANLERFYYKQALQKKFFRKELSELKTQIN